MRNTSLSVPAFKHTPPIANILMLNGMYAGWATWAATYARLAGPPRQAHLYPSAPSTRLMWLELKC